MWNYLENRDIFLTFAGKMKKLVIIFTLLVALCCCTTEADRNRMRSGLDSINALNRNDQPFTVKDVQPYVQFFDDEGTPNDRLLAYYLLGRAYYEAGEAPMALDCYQKAAECADTTSKDCDYKQLCRVYGQMADVYFDQDLYRQQLNSQAKASQYAWKANDTLSALICYERKYLAYYGLRYPDSAVYTIENVAKLYEKYSYSTDAAIALGAIVRTLVDKGDYQKAKAYMDRYESESGLFDSLGNIEKGREVYYKAKGLYYFYINKYDSAEYYFRKELRDGKDFNNQHAGAKGLAELFHRINKTDSVAKYYKYAYAMNDSVNAQKKTKDVKRIQAMYDYTRQQEIANIESKRAALANRKFLLSFIALLIISLITSWLYIARKQVVENLKRTSEELYSVRVELVYLHKKKTANQQMIKEKEERIKYLEKKLGRYGKMVYFGSQKVEDNMIVSPNYHKVKAMAYKGQRLSAEECIAIRQLIEEYLPGFYDYITSKTAVNTIEYHVCLLLRLHFKAGEVANMLDVTPAYISKISSEIYKKTFNKRGSSKELAKALNKIS